MFQNNSLRTFCFCCSLYSECTVMIDAVTEQSWLTDILPEVMWQVVAIKHSVKYTWLCQNLKKLIWQHSAKVFYFHEWLHRSHSDSAVTQPIQLVQHILLWQLQFNAYPWPQVLSYPNTTQWGKCCLQDFKQVTKLANYHWARHEASC